MRAYVEYMADPAHKALIKALPPITLPDGSTTRRGIDKRHFAGIWATMDPERKAVYQAAGAEALEAHHVRIGARAASQRMTARTLVRARAALHNTPRAARTTTQQRSNEPR